MNTIARTLTTSLLMSVIVLAVSASWAATPPNYVNYQGVLRDSADNPLDGSYDMVFRFYAPSDVEILIDRHTAAQGGAVTVSGGLFNVWLGAGSIADGSGPGSYGTLMEVFRDYNEVYLEVQIGADAAPDKEILSPRTRVISAPYALNAYNLAGLPVTSLLRSNDHDAYTFGTLNFVPGTILDLDGTLNMDGPVTKATTTKVANFNADLLDGMDSSSFSLTGHGHAGSEISGPVAEATNADTLDSLDSTYFLNTSTATQSKAGPLIVDTAGVPGSTAVEAVGAALGGNFSTTTGTGSANVAYGNRGIEGFGSETGGYFKDSNNTGHAYVGYGDEGIEAHGTEAGGEFWDIDESGHAWLAVGNQGIVAEGTEAGGEFWDIDGSGHVWLGLGNKGIFAEGVTVGGEFWDLDGTGRAFVAEGDYGIHAFGSSSGGYFEDIDGSGLAYVGYGDIGLYAVGQGMGGYFEDTDGSGYANLGDGDYGITARGSSAGGFFQDRFASGTALAGTGDTGIVARGAAAGGEFEDINGSGHAHVGYGDYGISAYGSTSGGYFEDADSTGWAYVGYGERGIWAVGDYSGGYFHNNTGGAFAEVAVNNVAGDYAVWGGGDTAGAFLADIDDTGVLYAGYGDRGLWAEGNYSGGYFFNDTGGAWAEIAYNEPGTGFLYGVAAYGNGTGGFFGDANSSGNAFVGYGAYKIFGSGDVSFVQNHPYDASRVVVYTAPEGDEVATYTRGTARLVDGEARVALGETFAWVTNPDLGLTAHVTARSPDAVVYVESVATDELVVRAVGGFAPDAVFDYLVYGLRIGFEEKPVLQPKQRESYIPSMADRRAIYEQSPELRSFNALERFTRMHAEASGTDAPPDLSASRALREAIHEYDPETDPPVHELLGHRLVGKAADPAEVAPPPVARQETDTPGDVGAPENLAATAPGITHPRDEGPDTVIDVARLFPVAHQVEAGDLLTLDPERPGVLIVAATAHDPGLAGIAAGEAVDIDGELRVELVETNYAVLKVDAGYGAIETGDLLTSSFTPGHAMRAAEIVPGTIIGKALEALDTGTGLIRVLVMAR